MTKEEQKLLSACKKAIREVETMSTGFYYDEWESGYVDALEAVVDFINEKKDSL